jgi:predicted nuclease of predicted toxin-antitoxin system
MKILLDECLPRAMKHALRAQGYNCLTVQEQGWSGKLNGELLKLAESEFDVLVTLDTNLQYQQNLEGRKIAIIIPPRVFQSIGRPQCTFSRLH